MKHKTQMQIVWEALHHMPHTTCYELYEALGRSVPSGTVSSCLSKFQRVGIVVSTGKKNGMRAYKTVGSVFVKPEHSQYSPAKVNNTEDQPVAVVSPANTEVTPVGEKPSYKSLDDMTVREAREMYAQLKEIFA